MMYKEDVTIEGITYKEDVTIENMMTYDRRHHNDFISK